MDERRELRDGSPGPCATDRCQETAVGDGEPLCWLCKSVWDRATAAERSVIALERAGVREQLADYAHAAWSGWMKYMFEKCYAETQRGNPSRATGGLVIPAELVERWHRQMNTPYSHLPESERESDRAEADKMLAIIIDKKEEDTNGKS